MGLEAIYEERRKILPVVMSMKHNGITINGDRLNTMVDTYNKEAGVCHEKCVELSGDPELKLPVNGRSAALETAVFETLGLPPVTVSKKTGKPSMDKNVMAVWLEDLDPDSDQYGFINSLMDYRKRKTAISYMNSYRRFWKPTKHHSFYKLHPGLNPTGTHTLRWSSQNPNQQNISKKEGFNLRYCFGPAPGRAWISIDYANIELRIPAYESGEAELIAIFENPDAAPYYGSFHLLNFHTVYPDLWDEAVKKSGGVEHAAKYIKDVWKSTWYQRCKNGGFAVQYGSMDKGPGKWSTADRAFGRMGSQRKLTKRFRSLQRLNNYWIDRANRTGYVETLPDKSIDPDQGYPIECSRTKYGNDRISPTIPLNSHTQSTACWAISRAMVKCHNYALQMKNDWYMTMQVHDELVFDIPLPDGKMKRKERTHLRNITGLMESCGDDIGVPLKVEATLHTDNWSEGVDL